ncbi:hypothetical protein [uncultured Parasutterella sp.]|uniref:hypothetical protein n=1 Tax=uncultured Parasutterella sp. TaxID=1263098 RepID=UPI002596F5E9|nr:hypothetical protein [uncultured Parasutterella sp.]
MKTQLHLSVLTAAVASALVLTVQTSMAKESAPNSVSAASAQSDEISGATQKREATSGAFVLTKTPEGKKLLTDMAADFLYTGPSKFDGKEIGGGRNMYSIATSYGNRPENITAELTMDYDPDAGKFVFYGTTAKDSGKILRASKSGTGLSVAWVKQLREDEIKKYGYNYYDSYGVQFDGPVEVITSNSINTGDKAKDLAALKRLEEIMGKSLTTIKEWNLLWQFDPKLTGKELEKAKEQAIRDFMSYEDVYVVNPKKMIIIGYFYRPLMVNPKNAFVYRDYQIDSSKPGFKLESAPGYQKALRDTNCAYTVSKEGRALYPFFDHQYPATSEKNLINRLVAYKNEQVFGSSKPGANAKPLPEALKKIEAMYNGNGKVVSKEEAEKLAKEANGKRQAIYWVDPSKKADMPDHYMITYTGIDSNGKPYIDMQPNWNRYFMLQPNNMCGIATRHSLYW